MKERILVRTGIAKDRDDKFGAWFKIDNQTFRIAILDDGSIEEARWIQSQATKALSKIADNVIVVSYSKYQSEEE